MTSKVTSKMTSRVRCEACGRMVARDLMASIAGDCARHDAGGEQQCLECHRELIRSTRGLECRGCQGRA